jgi:integrase/recombinase XerD
MNGSIYISGFRNYLLLERSLAANTIEAYISDVLKFSSFMEGNAVVSSLQYTTVTDIRSFLHSLHSIGLGAATQARIISGLRVFFEYLVQEKICGENPLELIDSPRLIRPIPDVLSPEEMIQLLDSVDLSRKEGVRNRAILELMYSCGLRVSELTDFKISCIHAQDSFVRIIGKGNKERLVPIGKTALDWMERYQREMRNHQDIAHGHEDFLFLNLRGKKLSRMSIFNFIQEVSRLAGISKHISPHGFRHAFATHLVEAGADLRAVQEMLGHASITTTEIYTHLDRNRLRDEILTYHPAYFRKS